MNDLTISRWIVLVESHVKRLGVKIVWFIPLQCVIIFSIVKFNKIICVTIKKNKLLC